MFSKYKNTISDRSLAEAYKLLKINYKEYSFLNRGSDERQYNSPGIDLPIASILDLNTVNIKNITHLLMILKW